MPNSSLIFSLRFCLFLIIKIYIHPLYFILPLWLSSFLYYVLIFVFFVCVCNLHYSFCLFTPSSLSQCNKKFNFTSVVVIPETQFQFYSKYMRLYSLNASLSVIFVNICQFLAVFITSIYFRLVSNPHVLINMFHLFISFQHFQCSKFLSSALWCSVAGTCSLTFLWNVNKIYQATWCYIPKDNSLHRHCSEDLYSLSLFTAQGCWL